MLTIYGNAACTRSEWKDLCCNPNGLGGSCTCSYPDDEIYPKLEGGGWKYFGYWLFGAVLTISVHLIAIHLFGVRHGRTSEFELVGFDLLGAALPVLFVGMAAAWISLEGWDGELILSDIKGTSAHSARFYLTMALCATYGLNFGLVESFFGFEFYDDYGIPAILACFYGVAIGLHHTSTWANWFSVGRCKAVYKLM